MVGYDPVGDPMRDYHAYGLRVRSAIPLPFDLLSGLGASAPSGGRGRNPLTFFRQSPYCGA